MVICLTVLVVWDAPLSLADKTRVRVVLAAEERYGRDLLADGPMLRFQLEIASAIVKDGEWIRDNLPNTPREYYQMGLALRYIKDDEKATWQSPRETAALRGGDCEDLTTYQVAFGMSLDPRIYKFGFIVLYPEVVSLGKSPGHIATVIKVIDSGDIYVWDLAFTGMRTPVLLTRFLDELYYSEINEKNPQSVSKYYRIWWVFEKNLENQPEMKLMPAS